MTRRPGKPFKVDRKLAIEAIRKQKFTIFRENNKIISKTDKVWGLIAKQLNNELSARTLYSMVFNPVIRGQILSEPLNDSAVLVQLPDRDDSVDLQVPSDTDSSADPDVNKFTIFCEKSEFEKLLEEAVYKRRTKGKKFDRHCMILKPGLWQEWITRHMWNNTRLRCAFNFKNSKVTQDGTSGTMRGTCNCGGTIFCNIDNCINKPTNSVRIDCTITKGEGQCGKRYLRAPIRQEIGRELCTKSATIYRTEQAGQLMLPGDPEPPHLYKKSALINAKHEYQLSQYLDPDPVRALQIMKRGSSRNVIHGIGLDPFFGHYWSSHQLHVYRSYAKKQPACIAIDATGSIIKSLDRCDDTKSGPIFLYHAVIHNEIGQFSVAQMVSERHSTVAISYWLAEWASQAVLYPKEVICDSSKALLAAAVKVFTQYGTIEAYAHACSNLIMPPCFIRIDVAHFLKMYADFLKMSPKRVKFFYLAAIGQLIQIRNKDSAREILESILLVARSETDGKLHSGYDTTCDTYKRRIKDLIDPAPELKLVNDIINLATEVENSGNNSSSSSSQDLDSVFNANGCGNYWSSWAADIDRDVNNIIVNEEGDRVNAHHLPALANKLLSDIRWFPLWSSVCRDCFGYGRVPASSASVESEFNIIKTHLLRNDLTPMRVDVFVDKHINYLNGRIKIIDARSITLADGDINSHDDDHGQIIEDNSRSSHVTELASVSNVSAISTKIKTNVQFCTLCLNHLDYPTNKRSTTKTAKTTDESTICLDCAKLGNVAEVVTSRAIEGWGGLSSGSPKKKNSYLAKNHDIHNASSLPKMSKIPIMKNGNNLKIQASKFGNAEYTFTKTCAFDSVLHAILAAACDRPNVRDAVKILMHKNPLLFLVEDILTMGLRAHSYRLRAQILIDINSSIKSFDNSYLVDCETNVNHLVSKVFVDTPSIEELSTCTNGCEPRRKHLRTIHVPRPLLMNAAAFDDVLTTQVAIRGARPCTIADCTGTVSTQFSATGPFMMIEVDDDDRISLNSIPKCFSDPITHDCFTLIGIVDFKPPPTRTRLSSDKPEGVGHYTTISLRPPAIWIEFNDVENKPRRMSPSYNAKPHLLIYFKQLAV